MYAIVCVHEHHLIVLSMAEIAHTRTRTYFYICIPISRTISYGFAAAYLAVGFYFSCRKKKNEIISFPNFIINS